MLCIYFKYGKSCKFNLRCAECDSDKYKIVLWTKEIDLASQYGGKNDAVPAADAISKWHPHIHTYHISYTECQHALNAIQGICSKTFQTSMELCPSPDTKLLGWMEETIHSLLFRYGGSRYLKIRSQAWNCNFKVNPVKIE